MIIDTNKIQELLNMNISEDIISNKTNVQESEICKFKNKEEKLENMTLETASKLMEFFRQHYVYDIDELKEIKSKLTINNYVGIHYNNMYPELEFKIKEIEDEKYFVRINNFNSINKIGIWNNKDIVEKVVEEAGSDDIRLELYEYEIIATDVEVDNNVEYFKGISNSPKYNESPFPFMIQMFSNLEEAKENLKYHKTIIEPKGNKKIISECYIEHNVYDEPGNRIKEFGICEFAEIEELK